MGYSKKVDKYYEKLRYFVKMYGVLKMEVLSYPLCEEIKEKFDAVIKSNNEYLLTDSFIYFLVQYSCVNHGNGEPLLKAISDLLSTLINRSDTLLSITKFFQKIRSVDNETFYSTTIKTYKETLNDYEKSLYLTCCKYIELIYNNDLVLPSDYYLLRVVFFIITAYVRINNLDQSKLEDFIKDYIDNYENRIEELMLQVCHYEYDYDRDDRKYAYKMEELANYVVSKLEDSIKMEIR